MSNRKLKPECGCRESDPNRDLFLQKRFLFGPTAFSFRKRKGGLGKVESYPTTIVLDNGKKKKVYEDIMTPVQKLLSIPNVERYLKEDVKIESLKEKMTRMSHLENAKIMHENKQKLFAAIKKC